MNNSIMVGDELIVEDNCIFHTLHGERVTVIEVRALSVKVRDARGLRWVLYRTSVSPATTAPEVPPLLPHDSAERKTIPLYSVLFGYFPDAMVALAKHSYESNEKHNPGEELHWSRGKSDDHRDAAMRHLVEGDYVGLLWRAAALLQLELESQGHAVAPLAR